MMRKQASFPIGKANFVIARTAGRAPRANANSSMTFKRRRVRRAEGATTVGCSQKARPSLIRLPQLHDRTSIFGGSTTRSWGHLLSGSRSGLSALSLTNAKRDLSARDSTPCVIHRQRDFQMLINDMKKVLDGSICLEYDAPRSKFRSFSVRLPRL